MGTEPTRMDGYIRVSQRRGREGPGYISIPVQREAIERWAAYKGVEIVAWHVDEDESGGTQDRPGLEVAVARCLAGDTGGIVSWKIDRFSRYTEGGLRDLRRLEDRGARLAFVVEDVDTSGPMGKFVYTVMLAMAEYFLDNIRAGWRDAHRRAMERGAKIGATPLGFRRRPDGTLEPHPTECDVMREAYRRAGDLIKSDTEAIADTCAFLKRAAPVHTDGKRAGRPRTWTPGVVRKLLANRAYLGELHYGGLPPYRDDALALVTEREWLRAQRSVEERRRAPLDYPLSGAAVCASCGSPLVGSWGGRDQRRIYRCSRAVKPKGPRCPAPVAVTADGLEDHVLAELKAGRAAVRGPAVYGIADEPVDDLDALQRDLEAADKALVRFSTNAKAAARMTGAEWDAALDAHMDERDALRAAYGAALRRQKPQRARSFDWATLGRSELGDVVRAGFRVSVRRGRLPLGERVTVTEDADMVTVPTAQHA